MHVFLLIIIPLMYFVTEYLCHNKKIDREQMFCIFWGIVIACIYAMIDFFAIGSNHRWVNSIPSVWGHFLVTETILPAVVCVIPVMFAKDTIRGKVQFVFPLFTAFMMVFLPYKVICETSVPDYFHMIIYPLMMAVMLFNLDTAASVFDESEDMNELLPVRIAVASVAVLAGLLLPSLFMAMYFLNLAGVATYILISLYIISAAGLRAVAKLFL